MLDELLYVIPANTAREDVKKTLEAHPEIKFVSLVGIDMAGNDTDEKIPMRIFTMKLDTMLCCKEVWSSSNLKN